jgi:antitoxin Phd
MKIWPVQDAKAKFSEMLDTCVAEGPQLVSKRGAVTAVLVPIAEWERRAPAKKPTLKEFLMSDDFYRGDLNIPPRGHARRRVIEDF